MPAKPVFLLAVLFALTSCATDSAFEEAAAEAEGAAFEEEAQAMVGENGVPQPLATTGEKPAPPPKLPAINKEELTAPDRSRLDFFGATVYADNIDPNTGQATGHVYMDGSALHANNKNFPVYVYCDSLKVDLAKGSVEIGGLPVMKWEGAYIIAKSPKTKIYLTKDQYRVEGPAQYGVDFSS